jgi:hypothetical protein
MNSLITNDARKTELNKINNLQIDNRIREYYKDIF